MPTTFHPSLFRTPIVNSLLGKASNNSTAYSVQFFNGAQPADPTITPVGTAVFTNNFSSGILVSTFMSAPALGVSTLSGPRSAVALNTVSGITFARIFDNFNGAGLVDTEVSLAGGGGGVIVPSLSSTADVAFQMTQFSIRLPQVNGTVMMNADLVNALTAAYANTSTNIAFFSSANLQIYSGAAPASADAPATGTLLVTFTTAANGASWGTVSAGSAALAGNLTAVIAATGTAGYARFTKGVNVLQCSVGTAGTDIILDTVNLVAAATSTLTEATISI